MFIMLVFCLLSSKGHRHSRSISGENHLMRVCGAQLFGYMWLHVNRQMWSIYLETWPVYLEISKVYAQENPSTHLQYCSRSLLWAPLGWACGPAAAAQRMTTSRRCWDQAVRLYEYKGWLSKRTRAVFANCTCFVCPDSSKDICCYSAATSTVGQV